MPYANKEDAKKYSEKWRNANRERYRELAREWRKNNPDKQKMISLKCNLRKCYNMSVEEWDALWEKQKGLCPICNRPLSEEYRRPCVDHDHETGKIRGIIHSGCNLLVGILEKDMSIDLANKINNIINYLNKENN